MKLWEKGGRRGGRPQSVCAFTAGEDHVLDLRLVRYDCLASMAHARALRKAGLLSGRDLQGILRGLRRIIALDAAGKFRIRPDEEDCHTAIENFLTRRRGVAGKRIHTGRSRNDQVAAALRLYYRDELASVIRLASSLRSDIGGFSRRHGRVPMPGYTHTRKAMPSIAGLWAGSHVDSFEDSLRMLALSAELFDRNPLGSAAGYGSPLRLDEKRVARELGFASVQENPLYVQNGRGKLEGFMLHALSQVMLDLNRMATDIILFTTAEFGYFTLPDELCTGSSIMPQKKNPDVLELVRARYHVVSSLEHRVMGLSGNLISGYNRDLQLTKGAVMEAFDTVKACLSMMSQVVKGLGVDGARCRSAMTEELFAAGKAMELARKGVPFRDAYRAVGRKYA
jgi:argininosuccinate lyase